MSATDIQSSVGGTSYQHLQSCRRLWIGCPDALTSPPDHPVFLLSVGDFPWYCATETKRFIMKQMKDETDESSHMTPNGMHVSVRVWLLV